MNNKSFTNYWPILFLLAFEAGLSYGQKAVSRRFDNESQIEALMKAKNIPALGIVFIDEGRLKEQQVYGELRRGQPASNDAIFNVASITKTITALVALRLVDKGEWDLDEPVYHFWIDPEVKDDPRSTKLTSRHILTHQTGFPNWRRQTAAKTLAFGFEPGTRFQYSGEGFEYLRKALENKFARSLDQLADSLIFSPLQMTNTTFVWNDGMSNRLAYPHNANGDELEFYKNLTPNAADLLKTTIADYAKFMAAIINGSTLSKHVFEQMASPQVKIKNNKYMGLGWEIYTDLGNGEYALSHGGSDPGVNTLVFILPESKRGLLILTNSDNGPQIYIDLLKIYLKDQGQNIIDIEMKEPDK